MSRSSVVARRWVAGVASAAVVVTAAIALTPSASGAPGVEAAKKPSPRAYQYGNWAAVGAGLNSTVYSIMRTSDDSLVAVGVFRKSGDDTVNRIARLSGGTWGNLAADDSGISPNVSTTGASGNQPASPGIYGSDIAGDGTIFVGGNFQYADDTVVNNVARWTGTGWKRMGLGLQNNNLGAGYVVQDMVVGNDPSHAADTVYADDTVFAVGGMAGPCPSLNSCTDASGSSPYGSPYAGVLQYRQADDTWISLGAARFNQQPITGVYLDDTSSADDTFIIAGNFSRLIGTADDSFYRIAAWSYADDTWHRMGTGNWGFNGGVFGLTVHPITGDVYAVGTFTAMCADSQCSATTDISDGVAKWDRQDGQWYSVGSGIGSPNLDDIAFSPDGQTAYVAGFSGMASGSNMNGIATLTGADLSATATNTGGTWGYLNSAGRIGIQNSNAQGRSLVVNNDGSAYVAGQFVEAGPVAAANVALFTPGPEPSPYDPVYPAGVPTDVLATSGWNKVTVDWTAPKYTGSYPITNYLVQATPGGQVCITRLTDPKLNQCTYTSLTPGVQYTFRVQALNGAGWGDRSAASNVASPQNLKITGYKRTKLNFFLGGGSKVNVSGSAAGFPNGTRITPWLMWGNSGTWEEQKNSGLTAQGGRFSWERKFSKNNNGKTLSVKFAIAPNESNSVSMGPVR